MDPAYYPQNHNRPEPRPLGALTPIVIFGLACCIIVAVVQITTAYNEMKLMERIEQGAPIDSSETGELAHRLKLIPFWQLGMIFGCGIFFIAWIHRAYVNIHRIDHGWTIFPTSWAIWCWMVPLMNTYRPYQIASEIWARSTSKPTSAVVAVSRSGISHMVDIWWGSAFAMSFMLRMAYSELAHRQTPERTITADYWLMASGAATIVAAYIAITFVRQLSARHERAIRSYQSPTNISGLYQPRSS